jgi:N-methylhydantoinase A
MANEIREMAMEQGQDPRTAALLAFGGAGPLFATLLSRELELNEIVIPPHAGNFSAWGLLGADVAQTAARTMIMRLQEDTLDRANEVLAKLFNELATRTTAPSNGSGATERRVAADMRYKGQEHTITVDVPATPSGLAATSVDDVRRAFIDDYARTFGHSMDDEIEIVALRATVRTPLPRRAEEQPPATNGSQRTSDSALNAYSFALRKWTPFRLIHRRELLPGIAFEGPVILAEETTTTYLDSGFSAVLDESGSLLVTAP